MSATQIGVARWRAYADQAAALAVETCERKVRYASRAAAHRRLRHFAGARAYRCDVCFQFHITSDKFGRGKWW